MRAAKNYESEFSKDSRTKSDKASTLKDARIWGRMAASLNWGLDGLADEVAAEFHQAAKDAYYRHCDRLGVKCA